MPDTTFACESSSHVANIFLQEFTPLLGRSYPPYSLEKDYISMCIVDAELSYQASLSRFMIDDLGTD